MDEIFGYFPPVSNPPSKLPLLTLLKQARAFGLGIVLVTQNPVDLDYKGLANAGTWFIGRLQTERDKARVIEGLEGASATQGTGFDRQAMEQTLAGLGSRVFLMNNVHENAPVIFETRWALSYLRGPLTRTQITVLTDPIRPKLLAAASALSTSTKATTPTNTASQAEVKDSNQSSSRPMVPPDVPQYFIPVRRSASQTQSFVYIPMLYAVAEVHLSDAKAGVDTTLNIQSWLPITNDPIPVSWDNAESCDVEASDLEKDPSETTATFGALQPVAMKAKSYDGWAKDFAGWIYRSQALSLFRSSSSGVCSAPYESERDFRVRRMQSTREARDRDVDALRQKYTFKIAGLEERLRRAKQAQEVQAEQAQGAQMQTVISLGATLLGGLFSRKILSSNTMGKATSAARGVARSMKESNDVARAAETVEAVTQQLRELNTQFESETAQLTATLDPATERLDPISIKPKKKDIHVKLLGLVWAPHLQEPRKSLEPAW
jgi:hypothetical protein